MTKSLKAVLLSAFVYPGAGQIFLKRYPIGIAFISIVTVGLYFVVSNILTRVSQVLEQIQSGQVPPDIASILVLVTQQSNTDSSQIVNTASTAIVATWFVSIIHAYLNGKLQENDIEKN